ncbi:MAG: hypothetical protein AABW50_00800 [Nanoarchaeota archaeon]
MAKSKVREITLVESKGAFNLFSKLLPEEKKYDFDSLSALRQLFSKEKARMIHVIKYDKPSSIYDLSKKLGRTFRSVKIDLDLLERFGFIEFIEEKTKNRKRLKPEIIVDTMTIHFKI